MKRLEGKGALVVGEGLRHEQALEMQRSIGRAGGIALTPAPLDATGESSLRAWGEEAVAVFGGIDILSPNAGTVRFGPGVIKTEGSRGSLLADDRIPLGRIDSPDDAVSAALFLA
ncbi:hypothetical protein [Streptomyces sp. AcE210]|uniref:hypothetical protein n=1 Tax=Streptomyces sp. AcE210 TaxID=2292703 RepID=UPI000E309CEA|nr:hypothetical protein [Streptomyces sp. AcE210]RFC71035.1 hypothetical protein DXZ75_28080 [Streptomyces sp. AcE210]